MDIDPSIIMATYISASALRDSSPNSEISLPPAYLSGMLCRDKTRDRLKLIARVVNVEQWAKEGPLSGYEHSLLNNYNDKPILTRPQQQFFSGESYLEVDLDVHTYAWLARKAFANFIPRLGRFLQWNVAIQCLLLSLLKEAAMKTEQ